MSNMNNSVSALNESVDRRDTLGHDGAPQVPGGGGQGGMDGPINLALGNGGSKQGPSVGLAGPLGEIPPEGINAEESGKVCRICLDEEEDVMSGNPFITPCKCMGSMKFIHLGCLREWTKSKMQSELNDCVSSYYWENLVCELCKEQL